LQTHAAVLQHTISLKLSDHAIEDRSAQALWEPLGVAGDVTFAYNMNTSTSSSTLATTPSTPLA